MFPSIRGAALFEGYTALINSVIVYMQRRAETIFKRARSKLTGTGCFVEEGFHASASSVPWIEKSTATGRAVQDRCVV
jgi:hypothetical protein